MYEDEPPPLTDNQRLEVVLDSLEWMLEELKEPPPPSRGRAIAQTKMQEAYYWLGLGVEEEKHKPKN
jgi:hypothetical protein